MESGPQESPRQTLVRVARALVADPAHGAERIQKFRNWAGTTVPIGSGVPGSAEAAVIDTALDAMVRLKAQDIPQLFAETKKLYFNPQCEQPQKLGYHALFGAMSDHLVARERRSQLSAAEFKIRDELHDILDKPYSPQSRSYGSGFGGATLGGAAPLG